MEGSIHVPYHELRDGPTREGARPIAGSQSRARAGNRSSVAASLLRRAGVRDLVYVAVGSVKHLPAHGIELVDGS